MRTVMPPALIDTNILIYACDPREPQRQERALQLLERLDLSRAGRLAVHVLAEFISVYPPARSARSTLIQKLLLRASACCKLSQFSIFPWWC
jgi:predicted nucleic acid-binding protein